MNDTKESLSKAEENSRVGFYTSVSEIESEKAATKIQAGFKGMQARQRVRKMKV